MQVIRRLHPNLIGFLAGLIVFLIGWFWYWSVDEVLFYGSLVPFTRFVFAFFVGLMVLILCATKVTTDESTKARRIHNALCFLLGGCLLLVATVNPIVQAYNEELVYQGFCTPVGGFQESGGQFSVQLDCNGSTVSIRVSNQTVLNLLNATPRTDRRSFQCTVRRRESAVCE